MKYLITGGCGFIGTNLALEVIRRGETLFLIDNLYRNGSDKNLNFLREQGNFTFKSLDVRNRNDIDSFIKQIKPDYIFHLAGQVAMTTSIENPRLDFEINTLGTFNLLEAIRQYCPTCKILYSSTNKVYGDFTSLHFIENKTRFECKEFPEGIPENISLDFHSPYGCSKGAADQYLLDYHRIYGLNTIVFRHSSMYGENQHSTFDQGWIGWFCQKALEIKKDCEKSFTISGNGKQVRDVLHARDVVDLYFLAKDQKNAYGQAFNIGGGNANSLSLIELFKYLENLLDIKMNYTILPWRESDQKVFIANNNKAKKMIGWEPKISKAEGIVAMINWLQIMDS